MPGVRHVRTYDGWMRRAVLGLITIVALCLVGLAPAQGATKPGTVGLVTFTAASPTSFTIIWPKASNATSYQVFVSTSYTGVLTAPVFGTSKTTTFTPKGLKPGTDYFIQVRAMNGTNAGSRSSRVGHQTIRAQGTATGPYYTVMSYNLCTRACMIPYQPGMDGYYTYWKWSQRMPGAIERITNFKPDVVMLQESECSVPSAPDLHWQHPEWRPVMQPPAGYAKVKCRSAKQLFYNDARFDVAPGESCMDNDSTPPPVNQCTSGSIYLGEHLDGKKFAVWAELVDKTKADKHVIFVSVHLVTGTSTAAVNYRAAEIRTLLAKIREVNPEGVPVVYGGDFNSHKNRSNDSVATEFHKGGLYDAFDLAMKIGYQHFNTYNGFKVTPTIGVKWGDHVDHVWVDPTKSRVISWLNGVKLVSGKLPHPIPSDHSPLVVSVQVN
ncbi:hypothetical protein GCM10022234_09830 [Aeromicrobium panaciterrae]